MYSKRMGFYERLLEELNLALSEQFDGKMSHFAKAADAHPTTVKRILTGERSKRLSLICRLADSAGIQISGPFSSKDQAHTAKNVHFVKPQILSAEDVQEGPIDENYLAVPLAGMPVAAGTGIIPEESINSWILVWTGQEAIRHRTNLAAVEIGQGQLSMVPTLHPGDLVLIDRNDRIPHNPPGNIYLIQEPAADEAGLAIKRVRLQRKNDRELVVFFSDNTDYMPEIYDLNTDYDGDLRRAIKGRVVWSWSDMTKK